jgi:hypothetical protein
VNVYYFAAVFAVDGGWNRKRKKKKKKQKKKVEDPTTFLRHYAHTNPSKFSTSHQKRVVQNCVRHLNDPEAHFTIHKLVPGLSSSPTNAN